MDRSDECGIEVGVEGGGGEGAGKENRVDRKEEKVTDNQTRGHGLWQLSLKTAPPAKTFVKDKDRSGNGGEQVELAGGDECDDGGQNEEEERGAVEAIGREMVGGRCDGGSHDAKSRIAFCGGWTGWGYERIKDQKCERATTMMLPLSPLLDMGRGFDDEISRRCAALKRAEEAGVKPRGFHSQIRRSERLCG